jgi:hypothetical protein
VGEQAARSALTIPMRLKRAKAGRTERECFMKNFTSFAASGAKILSEEASKGL